jgi:hypothetical protein
MDCPIASRRPLGRIEHELKVHVAETAAVTLGDLHPFRVGVPESVEPTSLIEADVKRARSSLSSRRGLRGGGHRAKVPSDSKALC